MKRLVIVFISERCLNQECLSRVKLCHQFAIVKVINLMVIEWLLRDQSGLQFKLCLRSLLKLFNSFTFNKVYYFKVIWSEKYTYVKVSSNLPPAHNLHLSSPWTSMLFWSDSENKFKRPTNNFIRYIILMSKRNNDASLSRGQKWNDVELFAIRNQPQQDIRDKFNSKSTNIQPQNNSPFTITQYNPDRPINHITKLNQLRKKQNQDNPEAITIEPNLFQPIRYSTFSIIEPQLNTHPIQYNQNQIFNNNRQTQSNQRGYNDMRIQPEHIATQLINLRHQQLARAKNYLMGKVSIVWIFIFRNQIPQQYSDRIWKMYNCFEGPFNSKSNVVPLCKHTWEINQYLEIPNSYFKIVTDLYNCRQTMQYKLHSKVVEIYIYNEQGSPGMTKSLDFKSCSPKVKGIDTSLQKVIQRAQEEIQDQLQFYRIKNGIAKRKTNRKFPTFIKLSGHEKTFATLYRTNLYGSLKISIQQKPKCLDQFLRLVEEKYDINGKEGNNIQDYKVLEHIINTYNQEWASQVVKFYVKQSFYYQTLNSMLRTMKTTQQFKPCVLPFNQTYHAIRMFYKKDLIDRKLTEMVVYRGAKLSTRDMQSLKPGNFIEIFGFMSTSKKLSKALQFTDQQGVILVIHIPQIIIQQRFDKYDHGFVDINKNNLAGPFADEQQVLFNALNIYRVRKVELTQKAQGQFQMIHLDYGVIFQLGKKNRNYLSQDERDVLTNYQYCTRLQDTIQDQGDVYLLANQHQQCKQYYNKKIEQNKEDANLYLKLANVYQQCGELDEAQKNANTSLKILEKNIDLNDKQTCMKVFSVHVKNANINLQKQDYLVADQKIEKAIKMLDQNSQFQNRQFQKAKKLRQLAQIKFKKGQIKDAFKLLRQGEKIFQEMSQQLEQKKKNVEKQFGCCFFALFCLSYEQKAIRNRSREQKLKQIEQKHKNFLEIKRQIEQQILKLNKSLCDVAQYVQDKEQYQKCVKKAQEYLARVKAEQTNDPLIKAHLKVVQATVQGYLQLVQSQKLLNQAIDLVQIDDPYNMKVGQYTQILARFQKQQLERLTNPKNMMKTSNKDQIHYDYNQNQQVYQRSKANFQKAISILKYNNKTSKSPQVINLVNQLGELEFNEKNFNRSEQILMESKNANKDNYMSEIAKGNLILSKIALAKGQLKYGYILIKESDLILRAALVKKQQEKYINIYQSSQCLLEIVFHKCKIYMKQLKHDLSLKCLQRIQNSFKKRYQQRQSHSSYATLYETRGQLAAEMGQVDNFDDYFLKTLQIRSRQMGQYNILNAATHCNYAKYLILTGDLQQGQKNILKAVEIFSRFTSEHPNSWMIYFQNGLLSQNKNQFTNSYKLYQKAYQLAIKKYDTSHIILSRIRLKYGKNLLNYGGNIKQSIEILEKLKDQLSGQIRQSNTRINNQFQEDDQKVSIKKNLLLQLKNAYQNAQKCKQFNVQQISINLNRCQSQLQQLAKSYKNMINESE